MGKKASSKKHFPKSKSRKSRRSNKTKTHKKTSSKRTHKSSRKRSKALRTHAGKWGSSPVSMAVQCPSLYCPYESTGSNYRR